jgi:catechol 2,3-dioxygenase-like lactoylglutathione lyase family enzyme
VSRLQLAINVDDVDQAVGFYSKLFGAEPAKRRPGYANFAIAEPPLKLVLLENPGQGGSLNHLGVEVEDVDAVDAEQNRLAAAGLTSVDQRGTTCCYAKQDKFWVQGAPNGELWEIYTVLADSETFSGAGDAGPAGSCCGTEMAQPGDEHATSASVQSAISTGTAIDLEPGTPTTVTATKGCC